MGMMRSLKRSIAKARLKDAGYDRVNKRISVTAGGVKKRRAEERGRRGRLKSRTRDAYFQMRRKEDPPVWRRVTEGDLAKKASEASRKAWFHRNIANEAKKMQKKQAHVKRTLVPVE